MVDKKYLKIGVACLAVCALTIGLAVGLTERNKNKASSSAAASTYDEYEVEDLPYCSPSSAKSGKSSGGDSSAKSGKSSGGDYSGKSGKSEAEVFDRRLVVPGTEGYVEQVGKGKRRQLRNDLVRGE